MWRRSTKQGNRNLKPIMMGWAIAILLTVCNQPTASFQDSAESSPKPTEFSPEAESDCQIVAHDAGETQICGQPQTVVTIGPNMLELLLALDIQPIGHAEYFPSPIRTFDQPAKQIPYLGERLTGQPRNIGTAHDPSIEAIAELDPDVILGDSIKNADEYDLLSQIAPTLLLTYDDADNDWSSDLRTLATALNRINQADAVIADVREKQTALREAIAPFVLQYPHVLLLLSHHLSQSIQLETRHSACGSLLENLGFQVIVPVELKDSMQASHDISLEALTQLDADLIIVEAFNRDARATTQDPVAEQLHTVKQQWHENAIAQSMTASQEGHVYFTTVYLCHGLQGPIGTRIFIEELQQQLQGET